MQYQIVKFDKKTTIFQWLANIYYFKTVKLGYFTKIDNNLINNINKIINTNYTIKNVNNM